MKNRVLSNALFVSVIILSSCTGQEKPNTPVTPVTKNESVSVVTSNTFKKAFNFMIVSDWGWNGYETSAGSSRPDGQNGRQRRSKVYSLLW
jgi:hypothetical protein